MTGRSAWVSRLAPRMREIFGREEDPIVALAPGRVNLIGEHTDYNDGWVLPMAIDREVGVAALARDDGVLRVHSVVFGATREIRIADLLPPSRVEWFDYLGGTVWTMLGAGYPIAGADLVIDGDVPLGSGLSSSAAVEMATARALSGIFDIEWDPRAFALLGQRVEWDYIGVKGGVMDQFTATMAEDGHAILLDCRTLEGTTVALSGELAVVVLDTGAPRTLAGSAYNDRSAACRRAVEILQIAKPGMRALRDVEPEELADLAGLLDPTTLRRVRHVVEESARPRAMAAALGRADAVGAGRLMNASHASLRDLYEVSSFELDLLTDLARGHPACFGARLTGAGFGGCAIALVGADAVDDFVARVHGDYRAQTDLPSAVFAVRAAPGAHLVNGG